ncbi:SAM-dependent methyltransferase [Flavobacterium sp. WLB]|uniref:THUMP-like domain-containing protein n=1 Tax=unclassified Flavobacterium TaxID=196869 RepID=UPI0006ABA2E7|nr:MULTISPECIES: class I SAM-dependent methyltransferase [unclassified Flavobacterium]KOP39958.1 SAM-dependent methyltransferase [Flavobacterium sp. VMW]OWU88511.1 SAM-dependent methyltransferase [Flavobacterium sp. NLM]PUU71496.1 SAM-dependent methyltransferase [Flavobacterium sp. WLB]
MNTSILSKNIQDFITLNSSESITKLALQKNPFPEVEWILILNQIEAKSKAKDKLPTWFSTENIIYPSKISVEQTSSEKTAAYKASLISGESLIDLTGGFGVDDYYFSKQFKTITHCEINEDLSAIVKHNFKQLGVENCSFYAEDSANVLNNSNQKFDWIYIDPSRRNDAKGKVFMLKDCLPNVPESLDFYFEKADSILIKTAPLLDISAGLSELKFVKNIHIIALENEVKELLFEIHKNYLGNITLKTANILKDKVETFEFVLGDDIPFPTYHLPQKYLYEANSAIMKSGGFDEVSTIFQINKLHKHSHLYTSEDLIDFPGRRFEIEKVISYSKNEMKTELLNQQANVTTRNFPETVENIRKKWKIKNGGNIYCFFTTDKNESKIVLICRKII